MTEKARGAALLVLVLSVVPGPALTADSIATANTAASADITIPAQENPPDAIIYTPYEPQFDYQPFEKRSQLGFHGMRGKKDFDEPEWIKRSNVLGFQGMRGKKWVDDELEKRATMGFQGMRGKKWYEDEVIKRASMGFQGMRGKKANMGFQGMRGKKNFPEDNDLAETYEDLEKRANMGFQGMRGKKDGFEKRANMGFQGMRGKKDNEVVNDYPDFDMDKRATMGFHGMRGKKQNELSFKRAMGFLGMRGKKSEEPSLNDKGDLGNLLSYLSDVPEPMTSSIRSRRAAAPIRSSKKARMAFFGMRGKKSQSFGETFSD